MNDTKTAIKNEVAPLPYELAGQRDGLYLIRSVVIDPGNFGRAHSTPVANAFCETQALAIVHACNLHGELVEALNELANAWIMAVPAHIHVTWSDKLCKVRAELAKAEGRERE